MRLADFITANREAILAEWVAFARTCSPASTAMDVESTPGVGSTFSLRLQPA
jgi:hypothetical protein